MKNLSRCCVLIGVLAFAGFAVAQRPVENIDAHRHPNLAEAQHHIAEAFKKIDEARNVNREELGGHGEKALQFLSEADRELKEAAEFANHRK